MATSEIDKLMPVKFLLDGGGPAGVDERQLHDHDHHNHRRSSDDWRHNDRPPVVPAPSTPDGDGASLDVVPTQVRSQLLATHEARWRQRERSRVDYLQRQHGKMLADLYKEIERLQAICKKVDFDDAWADALTQNGDQSENHSSNADKAALQAQLEAITAECRSKDDEVLTLRRRLQVLHRQFESDVQDKQEKILQLKKDVSLKDAYIARLLAQIKMYQNARSSADQAQQPPQKVEEQTAPTQNQSNSDSLNKSAELFVQGIRMQPHSVRMRRGMSLGAYTMPHLTAYSGQSVTSNNAAATAARHLPRTITYLPPIHPTGSHAHRPSTGGQQQQNSVDKSPSPQQHTSGFQRAGFRRLSGKLRADAKTGDDFWIRKDDGEDKLQKVD